MKAFQLPDLDRRGTRRVIGTSEMATESQDIGLLDIALIFANAWKWLVIIPLLAAILAFSADMFVPVRYTASAQLLMLERQALILAAPGITRPLFGRDVAFAVSGANDMSTISTTSSDPEAAKADLNKLLGYAASDEFHAKILANVTSALNETGSSAARTTEIAFRLTMRPQVVSTVSVTRSRSRAIPFAFLAFVAAALVVACGAVFRDILRRAQDNPQTAPQIQRIREALRF